MDYQIPSNSQLPWQANPTFSFFDSDLEKIKFKMIHLYYLQKATKKN
jgi:hypothetical protein